ncbi:MAG: hypothetical protein MJE66_15325 [Proteobacteria bacterium]|nr:hypothetical protein [Pseudomonadota bacterium]
MSKQKTIVRSLTLPLFPLLLLALLATGNCNACGCGPTRDYVGDYIDAN